MALVVIGRAAVVPAGLLIRTASRTAWFGSAAAVPGASGLFCRLRGFSYARTLWMFDVLAIAGVFAGALASLVCFLARRREEMPSALIDLLFLAALCVAFCRLDRRPRPAGFFAITGMIACAAFGVLRAEMDVEPHAVAWVIVCLAGIAGAFFRPVRFGKRARRAAPQPL
jgi:hypothetical protein